MHDDCFTITWSKVGVLAARFSNLAKVSYDTSGADMLNMSSLFPAFLFFGMFSFKVALVVLTDYRCLKCLFLHQKW